MSLIVGICSYINWLGTGLSTYASSFSSYLIKSTLGNYSGNLMSSYDIYILVFAPAANFAIMLIFYWCWKGHYLKTISEQEEDDNQIRP